MQCQSSDLRFKQHNNRVGRANNEHEPLNHNTPSMNGLDDKTNPTDTRSSASNLSDERPASPASGTIAAINASTPL